MAADTSTARRETTALRISVCVLSLAATATLTTVSSAASSHDRGAPRPVAFAADKPLEATYWKATELGGKPVPSQDVSREAHLILQSGGRVSGADGCNRFTGSVTMKDDTLTFGRMAATQMACVDGDDTERLFREALGATVRWKIAGDRMEFFNQAGTRVAAFEARNQTPPAAASRLEGTSWQLVRFQRGDGTVRAPDERSRYTIAFAAKGQLTARIDCNRGRGSWKSSGTSQIEFGPLALTRAQCPAGSMHDQIVTQWSAIRSYVLKDGHLFLALMADGGTYEFEPVPAGAK
jgi:heat shock protein HslJ